MPKVPLGERLAGETGPGSKRYAELETRGMQELARTAFCLVAGGLGERLGYPGIKIGITSEITTGTTFIETYISFILAFQAYGRQNSCDPGLELPLAIMTSDDTHDMTLILLKENNNFGMSDSQLTIMKQEKVPSLVDVDARISAKDGIVETKPHGHGDIHGLLYQTGVCKRWANSGKHCKKHAIEE